jgi:hypothetical protein
MKKIAILLLISSSLLIQNSFSIYKPCMCDSVMVRPNGQVIDCCGQQLGTYPHLAKPQTAPKTLPNEQKNCINKQRQKIKCKPCLDELVQRLPNGDSRDGCGNIWHN